jgi:hypothetical protein
VWLIALVLTLAWGAAAFGGNYPWAYQPLLVSSTILGTVACLRGFGRLRRVRSLAIAYGAVVAAVVVQLIPIPSGALQLVSPHAITFLQKHDLAYALGGASSHPLSIDPDRTLIGLGFVASFGVLLFGIAATLDMGKAWRLCVALTIIGTALAMVGIVQHAVSPDRLYGFWMPYQPAHSFGPFVNRNHFAGWMVMVLPMSLGLVLATTVEGLQGVRPTSRDRILWFGTREGSFAVLVAMASAVMGCALVLTMSRLGIIAAAAAIAMMYMRARRVGTAVSARRLMTAFFVVLLGVALISGGIDRVSTRFGSMKLFDTAGRLGIWADTVHVIRDFWPTGSGFNTFGRSMLEYQTAMPDAFVREAHNDYLQLIAEGGVLVGVPIAAVIVTFVVIARRAARSDHDSRTRWLRAGAASGLFAIGIQSLGDFSLQMPGNAALFVALCGLLLQEDMPHRAERGHATARRMPHAAAHTLIHRAI